MKQVHEIGTTTQSQLSEHVGRAANCKGAITCARCSHGEREDKRQRSKKQSGSGTRNSAGPEQPRGHKLRARAVMQADRGPAWQRRLGLQGGAPGHIPPPPALGAPLPFPKSCRAALLPGTEVTHWCFVKPNPKLRPKANNNAKIEAQFVWKLLKHTELVA